MVTMREEEAARYNLGWHRIDVDEREALLRAGGVA
jgi:hypothetical protein